MKQINVIINGVKYFPEGAKPQVNYRALVNDKLEELGTFYEYVEIGSKDESSFYLAPVSYANGDFFVIAGRIQEVLKGYAYYRGNNECCLELRLQDSDKTWEEVYGLLLKNEEFIKTGRVE